MWYRFMQALLLILFLLFLSTAQAQMGATKAEVDTRKPGGDFSFSYSLSKDGRVDYEVWYCETYHSAKVVLGQIEPAYTWKRKPGSNWNWLGRAAGKPTLHALYWHFHNPYQTFAYHCVIASVADSPENLWDWVLLGNGPSDVYDSP
jgi:hypothetical protein